MKITLVRHGKPVSSTNPKVTVAGFAYWVRAYNRSLVCRDSFPPKEFYHKFRDSYIISSDLIRAIHSTKICLGRDADLVSRNFREMDIPRLKLPFFMTVNSWLAVARLCWFIGISGKGESYKSGLERVLSAVDYITLKVNEHGHIVVFGHGIFNRFVTRELKRRGWCVKSNQMGFWGETVLIRN